MILFLLKNLLFQKVLKYIFELLAFLIYLELIELRFCGLNKNIRKNIEKRAEIEISGDMNNDISINTDLIDESDEKEKNIGRFSI